jgi:hypothetical protein
MIRLDCEIIDVRPHWLRKVLVGFFAVTTMPLALMCLLPFMLYDYAKRMWNDCFADSWDGR